MNEEEERQRLLAEMARRTPEQEERDNMIRHQPWLIRMFSQRPLISWGVVILLAVGAVADQVQQRNEEAERAASAEARRAEWAAGRERRERELCEGWTQRRAETSWVACGALPGDEGLRCLQEVQEQSRRCGLAR